MTKTILTDLKFSLFGTFTIQSTTQPSILATMQRQKTKWLLALLILRHGKQLERAWLADLLWPEDQEPRNNLSSSVTDLRKALGTENYRLVSTNHTLGLDLSGATVDVIRFDIASKTKDQGALTEAINLYTGPLLEDCTEPWILDERQRRQNAYINAVKIMADNAISDADHKSAIFWLKQVVWIDLLRQDIHRTLMQSLSHTGAYGAALDVYYELRRRLHAIHNGLPDKSTSDVYNQIWQQTYQQTSRAAVTVNTQTPPKPPPCRVPHRTTGLIGRSSELTRTAATISREQSVTITGFGGVGKTRLAIEVATLAYKNFAHGVYFVDLSTVTNSEQLAHHVAITLDRQRAAGQTWESTLISYLESRQLLLVLDNCEQILPACTALVRKILTNCKQVHILCTSRERLGLSGEISINLTPLSVPDMKSATDVEACLSHPAIELFIERARAIRSDFEPTPHAISHIVQIVQLLDGLPLGLELAAPLVKVLPLPAIVSQLVHNRFNVLKSRESSSNRHAALWNVIASSIALLSSTEHSLLNVLCAFPGGCTLEAIESTLNLYERSPESGEDLDREPTRAIDLLPTLSKLIDKSLIYPAIEGEYGDGENRYWRYSMLGTTREYLVENLESSDLERIERAHALYCAQLAKKAHQKIEGDQAADWLDRLEVEMPNLRSALAWSLRITGRESIAYELGSALWLFAHQRAYHDEFHMWLDRILQLPSPDPTLRIKALLGYANLSFVSGDHITARSSFAECKQLAIDTEDIRSKALASSGLGKVAMTSGDYIEAQSLLTEALDLFEGMEALRPAAQIYTSLALLAYYSTQNYQSALTLQQRALALNRQLGDRHSIAQALANLTSILLLQLRHTGNITSDISASSVFGYVHESLMLSRELKTPRGLCQCLDLYRQLAINDNKFERACILLGAESALSDEFAVLPPRSALEILASDAELIRLTIGDEAFTELREQGRRMTAEEITSFAGEHIAFEVRSVETLPPSPDNDPAAITVQGTGRRQTP